MNADSLITTASSSIITTLDSLNRLDSFSLIANPLIVRGDSLIYPPLSFIPTAYEFFNWPDSRFARADSLIMRGYH
jgi:hypothetical protein